MHGGVLSPHAVVDAARRSPVGVHRLDGTRLDLERRGPAPPFVQARLEIRERARRCVIHAVRHDRGDRRVAKLSPDLGERGRHVGRRAAVIDGDEHDRYRSLMEPPDAPSAGACRRGHRETTHRGGVRMRVRISMALTLSLVVGVATARAQGLSEGFDDITTLPGAGRCCAGC